MVMKDMDDYEGLFSYNLKPSVSSKKSDSGCYLLRSKTQPCQLLRRLSKW
ncbi:MAG: hypothetical protein WCI72_02180 [archaeon]